VIRGYWDQLPNQRAALETVRADLKLNKHEDWYNVKLEDLRKRGLSGLLPKYGNSLAKLLPAVFPEYEWKVWKFKSRKWLNMDNRTNFMNEFAKGIADLGISPTAITKDVMLNYGAGGLLKHYKSLAHLLQQFYPSLEKTTSRTSKSQRILLGIVRSLFTSNAHVNVMENYSHPDLLFQKSRCIHLFS
jgi:hypothetical protein